MPFNLGYSPSDARLARAGYNGTSLQEVARHFSTDEACVEHVTQARFKQGVFCQTCRDNSGWRQQNLKRYALHCCGKQISPLADTLFHRTRLPLRLWFYALLHFANSHGGISAGFLERHLGISYLAAFRMAQRIRRHLSELDRIDPLAPAGSAIEVRVENLRHVRSGTSAQNRVNILLVARDGKVACELLRASRQRFALKAVTKLVPNHGLLYTTCYRTARLLSDYGSNRPRAIYIPTYYMDHPNELDVIKGFLSYFLWPLHTHHKYVSILYLQLYLDEYLFRYNRRDRSADIYWDMISAFPNLNTRKSVSYVGG